MGAGRRVETRGSIGAGAESFVQTRIVPLAEAALVTKATQTTEGGGRRWRG